MLQELKRGDKVITSGGLLGTVLNIKEKENIVVLKLGENIKVEAQKGAIAGRIATGE
jgi:preprotein translocase subunit YajC